ncbi:MAG TPA: hypothetical protein VHW60_15870 [Caulobacteraceae bacterium]|jgi:hypothetical protein|nr:hypothetical protein [Caulobacteraceae bacterium]
MTAGSKALLAEAARPPPTASDRLAAFLAGAGVQSLTRLRGGGPYDWTGWSFAAGGCAARAFPEQLGGDIDSLLRRRTGPTDAVAYVFHGVISPAPPGPDRFLGDLGRRAAQTFASEPPPKPFYVALIYPPACPAARTLPWRDLPQ